MDKFILKNLKIIILKKWFRISKEQKNPAYIDASKNEFIYFPSGIKKPLNPYNLKNFTIRNTSNRKRCSTKKSEITNSLKKLNDLDKDEKENIDEKKEVFY